MLASRPTSKRLKNKQYPRPAPRADRYSKFDGLLAAVAHCTAAVSLLHSGIKIAIIGGGPAGLRAAEIAAAGGAAVTLYDAKPSVGRKFLVAGRGGLNLTHSEPSESFVGRYIGPADARATWTDLLSEFDAQSMQQWAADLGVTTFAATSGRVYPQEMKGAPLLRRWLHRLRASGVQFAMHRRWIGIRPRPESGWHLDFTSEGSTETAEADAVILALGGGSWPQTGSDGGWVSLMQSHGVTTRALSASNCGWNLPWPESLLQQADGKPLKNIVAYAGDTKAVGELLITTYGLEGGIIYQLGPVLSRMERPEIVLDLKPTHSVEQLIRKLGNIHRNFLTEARSRWRLSDAAFALLDAASLETPYASAEALAQKTKHCALALSGPRPIAEAISSTGGISWDELDPMLMLKRLPGVFVAGEMIDWDAPTGGYLLQGCFATGTRAAQGALKWGAQAPSA